MMKFLDVLYIGAIAAGIFGTGLAIETLARIQYSGRVP